MWKSFGVTVMLVLSPAIGRDVLKECLRAPVDGPLLTPFVAPSCPYCTGRRTLGFEARSGDVVRSPVSGRVHFVGSVGGSGYLTVIPAIDASLLVTVGGVIPGSAAASPGEPLVPILTAGTLLHAGQDIGMATGPVGLSVRRRSSTAPDLYLDPEPYLARWRFRARLVPLTDPGPADTPRRASSARFGCRRVLIGGAADPSPR